MQEIADMFSGHPCVRTVSRIIEAFVMEGAPSFKLQGQEGRLRPSRKMDDSAKQLLSDVADRYETSRLVDLASALCEEAGAEPGFYTALDVHRALHEMGMVRVRVTNRSYEANPDLQQQWVDYCCQPGIALGDWFFLDEVYVVSRVPTCATTGVRAGCRTKVR